MQAFILTTAQGEVYTGGAGDNWTSKDAFKAFAYTNQNEAQRKADMFNAYSKLHGKTFAVVAD